MQLYEPSMHTKLVNLSILLGVPNHSVPPVLSENDFYLGAIGLRIPLPEFGSGIGVAPDTGFSSQINNTVLFIECKSGGLNTMDNPTQLAKFAFVQKNPTSVVRTNNEFNIHKDDLQIDFAILCSDLNKLIRDHAIEKIEFPVLQYKEAEEEIIHSNFNGAKFKSDKLQKIFSSQIKVKRLPIILFPFGSCDKDRNLTYIVKNIILIIIEENNDLNRFERMASLNEIVLRRFPVLRLMGKEEFAELINTTEFVFLKVFPDSNPKSKLNIQKYITKKMGKVFIRKTTISKFLEKLENTLQELESKMIQKKLSDFIPEEGIEQFPIDIDWSFFDEKQN